MILQALRRLGIGLAIALITVLVSFHQLAASEPVHLTLLLPARGVVQWQGVVEDFERQNPDIKLDLIEGPNATNLLEDLYTTSFLLGNSPYDLAYMDIVWVPKFAAAGWLLDLTNQVPANTLQAFMPGDLNGGRYQDRLYRLPVQSDGGMLYYRQDLLAASGLQPPDTVEDLMAIARTLQGQGKVTWGYVWQGRQYEGLAAMFVEILQGFGGFWIDPQTLAVGLEDPEAIAAVKFLRSTITEGISPPGVTTYQEEEGRRLFQSGAVAMMRNWPYAWSLVNGPESPVAGKVGIKPMVHAPGYRSGACQGGWGLGIVKTTRHPEEAWRAVQFFTSPAAQRRLVLENSFVPTRRDLFQAPELVKVYSFLPTLERVVDNAVLRPPIAQYAQASDILQRYLSAAFTGRQSPEAAMAAAARETRFLLGGK